MTIKSLWVNESQTCQGFVKNVQLVSNSYATSLIFCEKPREETKQIYLGVIFIKENKMTLKILINQNNNFWGFW